MQMASDINPDKKQASSQLLISSLSDEKYVTRGDGFLRKETQLKGYNKVQIIRLRHKYTVYDKVSWKNRQIHTTHRSQNSIDNRSASTNK